MAETATWEQAHELIERLAPEKVPVVVDTSLRLPDPIAHSLATVSPEDEAIGSDRSHAEFLAEFGLTLEDWDRMGDEPLRASIACR